MPSSRASCGLIYGAMNTLKTTNLGRIARYLFETHGLRSRLISADNEWDSLTQEIDDGIIIPLTIVAAPRPFPLLTKLSKGMWPGPDPRQKGKLVMLPTPPEELAKYCYLIEGIKTISELLMQDHVNKARVIGQDVVGKFEEALVPGDEAYTYANPAQSHHYNVQTVVTMSLIPDFMSLPVRWVWWTGHEYKGEDEATGQRMLGPGVTGKAATTIVPRKVGNCLHSDSTETTELDPKTKKNTRTIEYRAYYERHADLESPSLKWPAALKMPAKWVPVWRERHPGGYIKLTFDEGIEDYLRFHDEMAVKAPTAFAGQAGVGAEFAAQLAAGAESSEEVSTAPALVVQASPTTAVPVDTSSKPEPLWKQRIREREEQQRQQAVNESKSTKEEVTK